MTQSQIQWAAQHDWFRRSYTVTDGNGQTHHVAVVRPDGIDRRTHFDDFRSLYEWAGY